MTKWTTYHQKTKGKPPRPHTVDAITYVKNKGSALDLGAGSMADSEFLADIFETVTAVDIEPTAGEHTDNEKIKVVTSSFEDLELEPESFDFVTAQYALPFIGADEFDETIEKIMGLVKSGGIMCGQFFGDNDEWNKGGKKMSFLTREQVLEKLNNFEIIHLDEEEKDKKPVVGDIKHWHLFHFVARKK